MTNEELKQTGEALFWVIIYYANHASEWRRSARKAFLRLGLLQCLARFEICRLSAVDLFFRHRYDLLRKIAEAVKLGGFFAHDLLVRHNDSKNKEPL